MSPTSLATAPFTVLQLALGEFFAVAYFTAAMVVYTFSTTLSWAIFTRSLGIGDFYVASGYAVATAFVAFSIGAIVAVFIGTPLALLVGRILGTRTPKARHALAYFVVGVVTEVILGVVDLAAGRQIPVIEALTSPTGGALALVTGLCAAGGWLTVWKTGVKKRIER